MNRPSYSFAPVDLKDAMAWCDLHKKLPEGFFISIEPPCHIDLFVEETEICGFYFGSDFEADIREDWFGTDELEAFAATVIGHHDSYKREQQKEREASKIQSKKFVDLMVKLSPWKKGGES